jgi:hypothetical protein
LFAAETEFRRDLHDARIAGAGDSKSAGRSNTATRIDELCNCCHCCPLMPRNVRARVSRSARDELKKQKGGVFRDGALPD